MPIKNDEFNEVKISNEEGITSFEFGSAQEAEFTSYNDNKNNIRDEVNDNDVVNSTNEDEEKKRREDKKEQEENLIKENASNSGSSGSSASSAGTSSASVVASVATVAVTSIAVLVGINLYKDSAQAKFDYLDVSSTSMVYAVELTDILEGDNYVINLTDLRTYDESQDLKEGLNQGRFVDLTEQTTYVLTVKNSLRETIVYTTEITTLEGGGTDVTGFMITFNPNGGSGYMEPVILAEAGEYVIPECTFTPPEGMSFGGWHIQDQEGIYQPGHTYYIDQDIEFVAYWDEGHASILTAYINPEINFSGTEHTTDVELTWDDPEDDIETISVKFEHPSCFGYYQSATYQLNKFSTQNITLVDASPGLRTIDFTHGYPFEYVIKYTLSSLPDVEFNGPTGEITFTDVNSRQSELHEFSIEYVEPSDTSAVLATKMVFENDLSEFNNFRMQFFEPNQYTQLGEDVVLDVTESGELMINELDQNFISAVDVTNGTYSYTVLYDTYKFGDTTTVTYYRGVVDFTKVQKASAGETTYGDEYFTLSEQDYITLELDISDYEGTIGSYVIFEYTPRNSNETQEKQIPLRRGMQKVPVDFGGGTEEEVTCSCVIKTTGGQQIDSQVVTFTKGDNDTSQFFGGYFEDTYIDDYNRSLYFTPFHNDNTRREITDAFVYFKSVGDESTTEWKLKFDLYGSSSDMIEVSFINQYNLTTALYGGPMIVKVGGKLSGEEIMFTISENMVFSTGKC